MRTLAVFGEPSVYPAPETSLTVAKTGVRRVVLAKGVRVSCCEVRPAGNETERANGAKSTPSVAEPNPEGPGARFTEMAFNGNPPRVMVRSPELMTGCP